MVDFKLHKVPNPLNPFLLCRFMTNNRFARIIISSKTSRSQGLLIFGTATLIMTMLFVHSNVGMNVAWADIIQCPTGPEFECTGTTDPDSIRGTSNSDRIEGLNRDEMMSGLAGNDVMSGNYHKFIPGRDLFVDDDDQMKGEGGADHMNGGIGRDVIDAGSGNDHVNGFYDGVQIHIPRDVSISDNDRITGGSANDKLEGNGGADIIAGAEGNDMIYHAADFLGY
jgi:hypothetical protein